MKNKARIIIILALIAVAFGVVVSKNIQKPLQKANENANNIVGQSSMALPKLIDLGADKCIPCKMMAPILEGLKKEYQGSLDVVFLDVWKNPEKAKEYNIKIIPTQIFFDASGRELFRHEGFFSKEDILAKWKEFGISLNPENKKE